MRFLLLRFAVCSGLVCLLAASSTGCAQLQTSNPLASHRTQLGDLEDNGNQASPVASGDRSSSTIPQNGKPQISNASFEKSLKRARSLPAESCGGTPFG